MALGAAVLVGCVGADGDTGDKPGDLPDPVALPEDCAALPAQAGTTVSDVAGLRAALAEAGPGDVVLLADGTYDLSGGPVAVTDGVTLRSSSGDAGAVVLEGAFAAAELVQLGDGATVAELSLSRPYADAVALRGASGARVYGVRVSDPGGRGVAVLPERGVYSDDATIACVTIARVGECAVGIEGVQSAGTRVYGTRVDQGACELPGVKFATGSRDTVIERTIASTGGVVAVQLGDEDYVEDDPRVYTGAPCPDEQRGHYGGVVRNVFALGGVRVEDACGARVEHVSAWGGDVSWSFVDDLVVANNLASLLDTGGATVDGNLRPTEADFVDAASGDLHLAEGSGAIDAAVGSTMLDDIDGDARGDGAADVGADERRR